LHFLFIETSDYQAVGISSNFEYGIDDYSSNCPTPLSVAFPPDAICCNDESPLQQFPLLGLHPFSCPDSLSTSAQVPDFHAEQQPQSPEYCLHHSISEKFNIRKLFESFGLFDEENSSNIVPEPSTVMQPVTSSDASEVIGSHQSLMMVDNYSTGSQYNGTPPAEVVEIGSEDTKCFSHDLPIDSDLSNNNADPDLEILENLPLKVVLSHSNFDLHPDDLGFYHYTPPPKKAKELYEAYEKGLVSLSSVQFIHKVPYEIKFSGTTLWNQMMRGGSFDVPMCDAIMRLFKSLDDQMYEAGHNRWSGDSATWRLLLPW